MYAHILGHVSKQSRKGGRGHKYNGNGETRPCSVVPDPEHLMWFRIQHADPDSTLHLDADLVSAFVFQFLANNFYIVFLMESRGRTKF